MNGTRPRPQLDPAGLRASIQSTEELVELLNARSAKLDGTRRARRLRRMSRFWRDVRDTARIRLAELEKGDDR